MEKMKQILALGVLLGFALGFLIGFTMPMIAPPGTFQQCKYVEESIWESIP